MKGMVKFLQQANKLKILKRAGWVKLNIENPESVADHTYRTAMMAIVLCPPELDKGKVLKMAIIHDLAETVVGDIITNHNDTPEFKKAKHEKEKRAMRDIVKDLYKETAHELISVWDEFEEQKTGEARFAKELDKLEMVFQAFEYEKKPDESFDSFWESTKAMVKHPKLVELLNELREQR